MQPPRLNPAEIAEKIGQLSRQPFRDQVALMLSCAPSQKAIVALAERSPALFWQAMGTAARLAGYTDKLEVEATLHATVTRMSDAELRIAIAQSAQLLAEPVDFSSNGHEPQA